MLHPHGLLFWTHFWANIAGIGIYIAAVLIFRRFARESLHRPTCIALAWVFSVLTVLLAGHTAAQLVRGLEEVLLYVDVGTRLVIAVAVFFAWLDTRRDPFALRTRGL